MYELWKAISKIKEKIIMNNDTQLINPNLVASLSEVMKNEKEAKEELYNSVINLFPSI